MSLAKPSLIDPRSREDVAEQTRLLLCKYLKWDPQADGGEAGNALIQIFAHLCSQVIDRINRAPEKNFLAFLDLLGNTLTPAAPARVPLSFTLSSSALEGVLLSPGTRLFASPPAGASEPVYFETEENLWLTTLELEYFLSLTDSGTYKPLSQFINNGSLGSEALFKESNQAYYFGFGLAEPRKLPVGSAVVLYFEIESPPYDPENLAKDDQLLNWEYMVEIKEDGKDILVGKPLYIEDYSQRLTTSGKVVFDVPQDFNLQTLEIVKPDPDKPDKTVTENLTYYWIRVKKKVSESNTNLSQLKWLSINTVTAIQAASVVDEILGSSTGNPNQVFQVFRYPVLFGQQLEIIEKIATAATQQAPQKWQEVTDFYASTAVDRHYLLDHGSGKVTFGNGQNGMIPPLGIRNISMKFYRYGGGLQGNVSAGAITNFWAPLSQVDKVINYTAATGGSSAESYESLLERAPKALRHRNRAVTESDYEDLARLATTEVALARCVPLTDLAADPYQDIDEINGIGKVSLIIVPRSADTKPTPSQLLIKRVTDYITPLAPSIVSLFVVGPLYLQVNTTLQIRFRSKLTKDTVRKNIQNKLAEFLHPLTGRDGVGWPFGRVPHESDVYALLSKVEGIDYVEAIKINYLSSQGIEKTLKTSRFLIFSGDHTIKSSEN